MEVPYSCDSKHLPSHVTKSQAAHIREGLQMCSFKVGGHRRWGGKVCDTEGGEGVTILLQVMSNSESTVMVC